MIRRTAAQEKAAVIRLAQIIVQRQSAILTDSEALTSPEAFEIWGVGMKYGEGQLIRHEDTLYRVMQATDSSQEHQRPGGEGMLALYRPVIPTAAGTAADPIPWIYGMDCSAGFFYSYGGEVYRCTADMLPCVWAPDSGIYQWSAHDGDIA